MCTSFQAKYKVLNKIGEGSFSDVLKCQDRQTGTLYAAKRLKKIYQNVDDILESPEIMAMRKVARHPNVLYMVESHYDPLPGKVTLIFELMEMSLYDLMRGRKGRLLMESRVKYYMYQLLKGLEHLHKHGIFHRDIKPENILLKGSAVKIGDLGSIRGIYSRPPYTEYISTRWYRSPECLLTGGFYGPKMDIWAVGCVFYELLTLEPLFPGNNEVDQIAKIHGVLGTPHARLVAKFRRISRTRNADFYFPNRVGHGLAYLLPDISPMGLEALNSMLVYDPENRSSARKLLEHRYFTDLRERESTRQTRSSVLSGDYELLRNPLIQGCLSSERRSKLRTLSSCQSQHRCMDSIKNNRTIESSKSASFFKSGCESKIPEPAKLNELRHTQVGRYFLRKRQSSHNNRLNSNIPTKNWYETNDKMDNLKYCDKSYQREKNASLKIPTNTKSKDEFHKGFFLHENLKAPTNREHQISRLNQLPSICIKPDKNFVCFTEALNYVPGDGSCKISLETIRQCPTQDRQKGLPTRNASTSKSPLKKMAKRENGKSSYHLRSMSIDSNKFLPKKPCEQRQMRFHMN